MGRELGLFSFSATVSRLGKWYQVSFLFIFPRSSEKKKKKKSGHWKGKASIPEGKHFSSYWEAIPQIINRWWSPKSKGFFIKSEISSMNETEFCWSEVVAIKSDFPSPRHVLSLSFFGLKNEWWKRGSVHGTDNFDMKMKGNRNCLELFDHFN